MNALKVFAFFLFCTGFVFSITEFGPGTALDCGTGPKDITVSDYYIWNTSGGAQMTYSGANNRFCLNVTVSDVTIDCDNLGTYGIINGGTAPAAAIYIGPGIQNVTILNCDIRNFNRSGTMNGGIRINQASNVLIRSNYFENDRNGIWINDSSDVQILENEFADVRYGAYIDYGGAGSDSFTISNNSMDTINQSGIHAEYLSNSLISENQISNTGIRGVYVSNGDTVDLIGNEVSYSCLAAGGAGMRVADSATIQLIGNEIHDCTCTTTGIYISDTPDPYLAYNNVHDNTGDGFYLLRANGADLLENNASLNTENGIYLSNSSFSWLSGNILHGNTQSGLRAANCQDLIINTGIYYQNGENGIDISGAYGTGARIENPISHDNGQDGIVIRWNANGALVTGAMAYSNGNIGIHILGADDASLQTNDAFNNTLQGIYVNASTDPDLGWNWVYDNQMQGIYVRNSPGATAEHNTVFGNTLEGFYVYNSDNGAYSFNTLESNDAGGYYIYSSTGCTISNDSIYWNADSSGYAISAVTNSHSLSILDSQILENENGVYIDNSDNLIVSGCAIYDNSFSSLWVRSSDNAQITNTEQYWNGAGYEFEDSTGDISDSSAYNLYAGVRGLTITGTSAITSDSLLIYAAADSYFSVVSTSTLTATNFWLGLDEIYGINYTTLNLAGTGVYAQNGNVLIAQDFISMDSSDINLAGLLGIPATLTTLTTGCNNLRYYNDTADAFPQSAIEILANGGQFTPAASTCDAGTVSFAVDGFSGYTVRGSAPSSGDGGSDKGTLSLDVSSNPLAGEEVTLTVESKGDAVSGAEVVVRVPYGAAYKYYYPEETDSQGETTFVPDFEGDYKATAQKSGYLDGELFFTVGPAEAPECTTNSDCASGKICSGGECETAPKEEQLPEETPECSTDSDCATGKICSSGTCMTAPQEEEQVDQAQLDAQHAIAEAQQDIANSKYAGKDTSEAERLLQLAQSALDSGNYEEAIRLANEARLAAQNAAFPLREVSTPQTSSQPIAPQEAPKAEAGFPWLLLLVFLVVLGGGAIALYWYFAGREKKK